MRLNVALVAAACGSAPLERRWLVVATRPDGRNRIVADDPLPALRSRVYALSVAHRHMR